MRRILAGAVVGAVLAGLPSGSVGASPEVSTASVSALDVWITTVNAHRPGYRDDWVTSMARLTYKDRLELHPAMQLFLAALVDDRVRAKTDDEARVLKLAQGIRRGPFLQRAAVLHSDAAMLFDSLRIVDPTIPPQAREHRPPSDGPSPLQLPEPKTRVPPLLVADRQVLSRDGQIIGDIYANWNWHFARSLVDVMRQTAPGPAPSACAGGGCLEIRDQDEGRGFVSAWYHATTAYMMANSVYSEAAPHLQHATNVLPDDELIMFDRGCFAEAYGLPNQQVLRADSRPGRMSAVIPKAETANADAEQWLRRALKVNPSFAEAHVRLGRLLDVRGRAEEALGELETALELKPPPVVAFYAHLFAGRAAQGLRRPDDARRHYAEASALFPEAQSARLARSQAALIRGDVPEALEPVRDLSGDSGRLTMRADPWWYYHLGAGRDLDELLKGLWGRVPK